MVNSLSSLLEAESAPSSFYAQPNSKLTYFCRHLSLRRFDLISYLVHSFIHSDLSYQPTLCQAPSWVQSKYCHEWERCDPCSHRPQIGMQKDREGTMSLRVIKPLQVQPPLYQSPLDGRVSATEAYVRKPLLFRGGCEVLGELPFLIWSSLR